MKIKTTEEFIKIAKEIHGDKYEYSKSEFINMNTKLVIICPIHGEFLQTPKAHVTQKYGCKKCGRIICGNKLKSSTDEFISKAIKIHGDKYDYSKVEYVNAYNNTTIICKKHGEFSQVPHDHLKGAGCPKCGIETVIEKESLTNENFIKRSIIKHGDFYNYDKCDVKNLDKNGMVTITCPMHGDFKMKPHYHINGNGCKKCGNEKIKKVLTKKLDTFISEANLLHKNKYSYNNAVYKGCDVKLLITCPIHGVFKQTPHDHLQGSGCPHCGQQISNAENELYEFCCKYLGKENVEQRNRDLINPKELDIYLPTLNTAIEYNGLRWHSERFGKDKKYHINKLNKCKEKNIKLLQVFEDEYINHKDIVFNKIKHILKIGEILPKIPARKCKIMEIKNNEAEMFLEQYHIQGYVRSTIHLGAFYDDKLIGVMSFKKESKNGSEWELTRFASDFNYICQGIGGKLFKNFIRNYSPMKVKSFADRRWTIDEENNIYKQLGFSFDSYTNPEYRYYKESDGCIRQHKFGFRKNKLHKKYGLPLTMTESEMITELGYTKIYDCGLIKYVWNNI